MGIGSPTLAGLAIGLGNMIGAVASLFYARLRARLGVTGVFGLALGFMATGYVLLGQANSLVVVLSGAGIVWSGPRHGHAQHRGRAMAAAAPEMRGGSPAE